MTYPVGSAPHAIEIAKMELGYIEQPENITKYGEAMKAQGLPWCGSFCNWVLKEAGVKVHSVVSTVKGGEPGLDEVGHVLHSLRLVDLSVAACQVPAALDQS